LADGGQVCSGALIRSDNLDQLDDAGLAAVEAAGISRFVDVRSAWECAKFPSPFAADDRWLNVPLTDPDDPDDPNLFEQYRMLIDDRPDRFATAIGAIADAPPGCVVVNCHAGKDRTGLVIALALDVVGVPFEIIAADYLTTIYEADPPRPETIHGILTHLRTRYGGTARYLQASGATAAQLVSLRTRMTS
jgi:protein-tyrosine phosphatase